ncbi:hypothetical protein [Dyadobacter sp. LHD-138]|uniref:hypothetical protein n=1 Tax=Dyadobacter sp. LHD-138 TaxID=3071413 RepID=UPI0027E0492F|nr:hypothetical protein [Dyadobacter sp. LHD-138]MDQ6481859.1 hypothetical protein [Dyadobacter sp. LHD-138]
MKRTVFILVVFIVTVFDSCKEKEDPGPDLTSKLVGEFNVRYQIVDMDNGKIISKADSISLNGVLKLTRKNNNTLIVQVDVKDGNIEIHDKMEGVITEDKNQSDNLGKPGLLVKYRVLYRDLAGKSLSDSWLNLYKDGAVRGGLGYLAGRELRSLSFGS